MKKFVGVGLSCAVALAFLAGLGRAQEQEPKKTTEAKTAKGKLPTYFGQIGLSKKQESEIRKACQPFDDKIMELRRQIAELQKQVEDQEAAKLAACEQLLTDGQKTALKERRETAVSERNASKKTTKKPANGEDAKPDPKP